MRKDATEFRQRFLRWKNGEQVYDKGRIIPHYRTGLDGEDDTILSDNTRVVNPRLLTAEKIVDLPTAAELMWAKHEATQIGPATPEYTGYQYDKDRAKLKYETQLWVLLKKALELATDEMMKAVIDPRYAALGFGLGQVARAAGSVINAGKNLYKGYKVSRAIDKAVKNPVFQKEYTTITPNVRTRIGDVEIDNPQLAYRQGDKGIVEDFLKSGEVRTPEGDYSPNRVVTTKRGWDFDFGSKTFENPMFAQGYLWYGVPQKAGSGLLTTAEPLGIATKESRLVKSVSNGTFDLRYPNVGKSGRRVQLYDGQLSPLNTSAYLWEPGYGYKKVFIENKPTISLEEAARPAEITTLSTGSKINIVKPDDFSFEFRPGSNIDGILYSVFDRMFGRPKKDLLKFQQYTENAKAATPESVESAFKTRKDLYSGKWETGEYREPIAASRKSNADFVEKYINEELRPKYPNATEDELRGAIFRESTGNTIEDVMGANGFVYRNDAGRLVHAQYTNNPAAPVRSTLSKLHEANHTSFYFDEHRIDNKIMQRLKTPEGEKTFFKESAGVKSPNFDNPSPNEFYLDADETTTYLSEAANLLGKTTPWTAQELLWLSNNLSVLSPIKNYSVYRDLFNRVFDYKKFAKAIKGLMYSSAATLTIPTINE